MYKNINDFAKEITKLEGGKKNVNIAQIKEILKVINILVPGFYDIVKGENKKQEVSVADALTKSSELLCACDASELLCACDKWDLSRKNSDAGDAAIKTIRDLLA